MLKSKVLENMKRIWKSPMAFARRAVSKLIIDPLRYGTANGYDAARYWDDRLRRYGISMKGPGDEGLTEEQNMRSYEEAKEIFMEVFRSLANDFSSYNVLEVGTGGGFYTRLLWDLGVRSFTGVDITDALFSYHRLNFPGYNFIKQDVTTAPLEGKYELVVIIDVLEHIVEKGKLEFALKNIASALKPGGDIVIGPVAAVSAKHLYYVRFWDKESILPYLPDCIVVSEKSFRNGTLLVLTKSETR